jgi:excisionase family DNA binding protein
MDRSTNLTVVEVAEILEIKPRTVRKYIERGHFPGAFRLDPTREKSEYRIPKEDVSNFLAKQGRKAL